MNDITPPEVLKQNSVTIIRIGEDYANLFGSMFESLSFVQRLAESVTPPRLVVDLRQVKFIGSAFLGFIVTLHKTLAARESGRFALCGLNSFCQTAISVAKLQNRLEIYETTDDAVQALSADF